jgi:hypothetical protein
MTTELEPKRAFWELPEAMGQQMEPLIPPRKSKEGRP